MHVVVKYPDSTKSSWEYGLHAGAHKRCTQLTTVHLRHRGTVTYVDGVLTDGNNLKLCDCAMTGPHTMGLRDLPRQPRRLRPVRLRDRLTRQGLRRPLGLACGLYLGDPTVWT